MKKVLQDNFIDWVINSLRTDLETNLRSEEQASTCVSYDKVTKIFKETTDNHAPQKKQETRGNQGHL